ncbi:unnamed protein product [Arctogadus glacialis]
MCSMLLRMLHDRYTPASILGFASESEREPRETQTAAIETPPRDHPGSERPPRDPRDVTAAPLDHRPMDSLVPRRVRSAL